MTTNLTYKGVTFEVNPYWFNYELDYIDVLGIEDLPNDLTEFFRHVPIQDNHNRELEEVWSLYSEKELKRMILAEAKKNSEFLETELLINIGV